MKRLIRFYVRLLRRLINARFKYVRLTPSYAGKIRFLDKEKKKIFSILSRCKSDSITADQIYTDCDYDIRFLERYKEIILRYKKLSDREKCLIIDCGANIGVSTRYFSEEFPEAYIFAVEPDKDNCKIAKLNTRNKKNIVIENAAIGASNGFADIENRTANPNAFRVSRKSEEGLSTRTSMSS